MGWSHVQDKLQVEEKQKGEKQLSTSPPHLAPEMLGGKHRLPLQLIPVESAGAQPQYTPSPGKSAAFPAAPTLEGFQERQDTDYNRLKCFCSSFNLGSATFLYVTCPESLHYFTRARQFQVFAGLQ